MLFSCPVPVPRNTNGNPLPSRPLKSPNHFGLRPAYPSNPDPLVAARAPEKYTNIYLVSVYRPMADVACQAKTYLLHRAYMIFGQEPCKAGFSCFVKLVHPLGDNRSATSSPRGPLKNTLSIYRPIADVTCLKPRPIYIGPT